VTLEGGVHLSLNLIDYENDLCKAFKWQIEHLESEVNREGFKKEQE
jgi:hypothetical protein